MTSFKQIEANRRNARRSTGPRSAPGKSRSRGNALRHGLTADTVIAALENAADYQVWQAAIVADYRPRTTTERALVLRLTSVLWRLRRSTQIETGLFQMEAALLHEQRADADQHRPPPPEWRDDIGASVPIIPSPPIDGTDDHGITAEDSEAAQDLASCFIRAGRLGHGAFDLLNRYESALWRQASQLLLMLQSVARR